MDWSTDRRVATNRHLPPKPLDPWNTPEKLAARRAVRGMERPTECERCDEPYGRIEAHHEDYSKPLEVVWLCISCHRVAHGMETGRHVAA